MGGNKKKSKEEKEEEARRLEEEEKERETNEIIKDVEDLLQKTESVVYAGIVEEKAVDRATRTSLENTILSESYLDCQKCNSKNDVSWHIDEEPESPPIDNGLEVRYE